MLISIVIPCYQQEMYLERALDSVMIQDCRSLEVIIVDDGSTKPVVLPVKNYSFQIKLLRQSNQGLSAARNTGIKHANGKLIKFLDADDTLLPGCLAAQAASIRLLPGTISIIGFSEINEDNDLSREVFPAFGDVIPALMIDNLAPVHSFLFHKCDLLDVAGFDTTTRTEYGCEDYDLVFRMALNGNSFITIHKIGAVYHRRDGSMSSNLDKMKSAIFNVWMYNILIIIKNNKIMRPEYLIPILVGLSRHLDKKPCDSIQVIDDLNAELMKHLYNIRHRFNFGELQLLLGLIDKHHELQLISQYIKSVVKLASVSPSIKIQEMLDYRMCLLGMGYRFSDQRIRNILYFGSKFNNNFAIYGAGEIGLRINSLLSAAGIRPKYIIDKNPSKYYGVYEASILSSESISEIDVNAIIIASDAYYNEIYEYLLSVRPEFEVI
ncbi:glycosyltransferase family 2 protein [Aeromonas bestiarum]|uniref:glycosyltransferase family 2 protein n=1 Tax=Aeromonas bestiarum TaxID=105751 RepID=UPI003D1C313E